MIFLSADLSARARAADRQPGLRETLAAIAVIMSFGVALLAIDPAVRSKDATRPALQTALVSPPFAVQPAKAAPDEAQPDKARVDFLAHVEDLAATPNADEEALQAQLIAFALSKVAPARVVAADQPARAPAAKSLAVSRPRLPQRTVAHKGKPGFKPVEWPDQLTAPPAPPGFFARHLRVQNPLSGVARYVPQLPAPHFPAMPQIGQFGQFGYVPKGALTLARTANQSVSSGAGFLRQEIRRGASSLAQLAGLQAPSAK